MNGQLGNGTYNVSIRLLAISELNRGAISASFEDIKRKRPPPLRYTLKLAVTAQRRDGRDMKKSTKKRIVRVFCDLLKFTVATILALGALYLAMMIAANLVLLALRAVL